MKKILLATTVLAATAGFAAADVVVSGSAGMGVAREGNDTTNVAGEFQTYSSATVKATMSSATDNGLSFGASMSASAGQGYSFGDSADGFDAESGAFGQPEVFISGDFGTLSMKQDGYNFFVDDSDSNDADVKYVYSAGALSLGLVYKEDGEYSANVGYTADALSVGVAYDSFNGGAMGSVGYTAGAITGTLTAKNAVAGANSVKVAYAADGMSASLKLSDDDSWEVEGGYSVNGFTVGMKTTSADAWKATGAYDLGGGASVEAGLNHTSDAYAGVKVSF